MARWSKLPEDLQKAILTMIVVLGGTGAACRFGPPIICDPAPPPSSTPMIFDPPPPPATATPPETPETTSTPMIFDPPPPPATSIPYPEATLAPGQHFVASVAAIDQQPGLDGVAVKGTVRDAAGTPLADWTVIVTCTTCSPVWDGQATSDAAGSFSLTMPQAGSYTLEIWGDTTSRVTVELDAQDAALVNFTETWDQMFAPLPLAEIRMVTLIGDDDLVFSAESDWHGAGLRWSVSGGSLVEDAGKMRWLPPAEPGRYLIQVVADWGWRGLAVDSAVLVVTPQGRSLIA
jgi:hypothetical protein